MKRILRWDKNCSGCVPVTVYIDNEKFVFSDADIWSCDVWFSNAEEDIRVPMNLFLTKDGFAFLDF